MNETEKLLEDIGLTGTETKIYLSGLSNDSLTVHQIVRKTKIKRPTVYHALSTLLEKGLVVEKKTGSKSRFTMSSPESIRGILEIKKENLEEQSKKLDKLIPLLLQQKKSL